jgi:hypothetical protein
VALVWLATVACTSGPASPAGPATPRPSERAANVGVPAPGKVIDVGPMLRPRAAHTATALRDGRVLLAGGFGDSGGSERTAELFDPQTRGFSRTGSMSVGRQSHTATLLKNGNVLITGGYDPRGDRLASAELYDPSTGRFTLTGRMSTPRGGHTATLLRDGRVLIVGGTGPGYTFLKSVELYDPRTGRFSPTGSMSVPRESATATLLQDGRVLIAGGHAGRHQDIRIYASTELYSLKSGTFSPGPDLSIPRHKHDAVLLNDGRVLIVAGSDERDDQGLYDSAELFDPTTASFTTTGSLREGRYKMQGTTILLADGKALVCCGGPGEEVFDPVTEEFHALSGTLGPGPLFAAAARVGPRTVLVTGGYSLEGPATDMAWLVRA